MDKKVEPQTERRFDEYLEARFVMLPTKVLLDLKQDSLSYRDICLYLFLLAKQGNKDYMWYGIDTLAILTGLHPDSIKESLRGLQDAGHVRREARRGRSSLTYCLTRVKRDGKVEIGEPATPSVKAEFTVSGVSSPCSSEHLSSHVGGETPPVAQGESRSMAGVVHPSLKE